LTVLEVYERAVALGASPARAARVEAMRRDFEARTGAFLAHGARPSGSGLDLAWFEARSRAFWDDAVTRQGFAREVAGELGPEAEPLVGALERAHRGLFRVERPGDEPAVLADAWSGAAFFVDDADPGTREALEAAAGLFDARLVGTPEPPRVAILPGALFHPENATPAIDEVLAAARARGMAADAVLDALLRMERSLRSLSRVKAGYAYRAEALGLQRA
jgi:hypothetical protein